MDKPIVSICCLAFNHGKYIRQCLEGFVNQETHFEYEVLIHDDASTDNTAEIIKEYENRFPGLIKPIYQTENQFSKGVKPSFKYNFPRARGKYIALCEGDDYWTDPYKLKKQVDFLENNPDYTACFTNASKLYIENGRTEIFVKGENNSTYSIEGIIKMGGGFFPTGTLVFKNIFKNYPEFIYQAKSGDRALSLLLADKGDFYFLNENTGIYRIHNKGVFSQILNDDSARNAIRLNNIWLLKEFDNYTENRYNSVIREAVSSLSKRILLKKSVDYTLKAELFKNLIFRDKISYFKQKLLK